MTTVFAIVAHDPAHTPADYLYGSHQIVFPSREAAQEMLTYFTDDPCWGPYGDELAAAHGVTYEVEEVDVHELMSFYGYHAATTEGKAFVAAMNADKGDND